ncbi:MAG: phosphoribosylformylglycinamidine synthase [Eubacteriales bacterium]
MSRLYVEKKPAFRSHKLLQELSENLKISTIKEIRILLSYDVEGAIASPQILAEGNVDDWKEESWEEKGDFILGIRPLDGQFDVRAAFAEECLKMADPSLSPKVKTAVFYIFYGTLTEEEKKNIEGYLLNPVESSLCTLEDKVDFSARGQAPQSVEQVEGFETLGESELKALSQSHGFAMSLADLMMIQAYFKEEGRSPTITELKVIDTYWSDHCRHTTFMTQLEQVHFADAIIEKSFQEYLKLREDLSITKPICLMDLATIGAKYLKKHGKLEDLDESEEINACSIKLEVQGEPWLLMFKNETHNHPTEIEPFGGAATCLGGAIRDPLSGRSYVFAAMRVTGAADPRGDFSQTIQGKLPQKIITTKAALGYSSYGNQIGLATGGVYELYHPDYVTKRMEVGAVLGACPAKNVVRETPVSGDVILLLGGRTGRDGIGGATGSSKVQTDQSTSQNASEVQKGNPVEERKIQRLFRNPKATTLIKRCNDFGAGGVCVAVGELAPSLSIDLNAVPKKYEGLDGTELAISESQERMAVVLHPKDVPVFLSLCQEENLEVTPVAKVTDSGYLTMEWNGEKIFHVKRAFLDTNGAAATTKVEVSPVKLDFFTQERTFSKESLLSDLGSLSSCSQKGLSEHFDSTIGTGTVLSPFGGKHRLTPPDGMAVKLPMLPPDSGVTALMSYGCIPELGIGSPFHAGVYSVIDALSKIVAMGGNYEKVRLSNQEYFERMVDETAFGKPVAALLGVLEVQRALEIPSIGGKDSMSGSFGDLKVPPTIISFAVTHEDSQHIISPEFKQSGSEVYFVSIQTDKNHLPNYEDIKEKYQRIYQTITQGTILSAKAVSYGHLASTLVEMMLGNDIVLDQMAIESAVHGFGIVIEVTEGSAFQDCIYLGKTVESKSILFKDGNQITLEEMREAYTSPLEKVFPSHTKTTGTAETISFSERSSHKPKTSMAKPKVFIPVFPGTNCEYDTISAFESAGAICETIVFRNGSPQDILETLEAYGKEISKSKILMLPGGFSASDEPDGSAKFITAVLKSPKIKEEIQKLYLQRDGLILGICNGFQALVKVGLLPFGEIKDLEEGMPTLTYNEIGRHISCLSDTRVASCLSPWLSHCTVGDLHTIAMSHGEGRFVAEESVLKTMIAQGQIATQYVNPLGQATMESPHNPNGSVLAIEGISSPCGRIFGKMGHSERYAKDLYQNIQGNLYQPIFAGGVDYFK